MKKSFTKHLKQFSILFSIDLIISILILYPLKLNFSENMAILTISSIFSIFLYWADFIYLNN